jgi:RNA polymerase sigma factor (sigma-70 family)
MRWRASLLASTAAWSMPTSGCYDLGYVRKPETCDRPALGDRELLQAWRGGDQRAGARLFERHASSVAFFFRNKLTGGVEDLVQQTFLGLVEGRERIEQGASVRAYLFGIANKLLLKHLRTLTRAPSFDPGVDSVAELDPGPSTLLGRKQEQRLLLEGLRRIPVDHQVALELYYWEERTPGDPNPATWRAFGSNSTGSQGVRRWLPVLPSAPACAR